MDENDEVYKQIRSIAEQINAIQDSAYSQYRVLADNVVNDRITDIKDVERIMDGLCDFGDDVRFIALYRKVCRHIYYHYPELVGEHIALFRAQWMTKDDELDE